MQYIGRRKQFFGAQKIVQILNVQCFIKQVTSINYIIIIS
jgi:hypothetical protein